MITLLIGTNRPGSNTRKVARHVEEIYAELNTPLGVIDLADLPAEIFHPGSYTEKPKAFRSLPKPFSNPPVIVVTPNKRRHAGCA
jgi:NAD(P)H-dependent FMN reductase